MPKDLESVIKDLFIVNLGIEKKEKVLVFTDTLLKNEIVTEKDRKRRIALLKLAKKITQTGKQIYNNITFITYPSLKGHGMEPPEEVWTAAFGKNAVEEIKKNGLFEKLLKKQNNPKQIKKIETTIRKHKNRSADAIIALSNYSTSHTKFRHFFTNIRKSRYASMPLFDKEMFYGAMQADLKKLSLRTLNLARKINKADKIIIKAPNGTNITMGIKGRKALADTGILTKPGSFGNLPAGEVYLAPVEGTTKGIMVLDWAPTFKLGSPVSIDIENGLAIKVSGKDAYAKKLHAKFNENPDFRNVAELGIGTNDMAKRPDNILESEKILGTIHIAFGDNSTFGGNVKTPFHQDFVIFNPTVIITKGGVKKIIIENGTLIIK